MRQDCYILWDQRVWFYMRQALDLHETRVLDLWQECWIVWDKNIGFYMRQMRRVLDCIWDQSVGLKWDHSDGLSYEYCIYMRRKLDLYETRALHIIWAKSVGFYMSRKCRILYETRVLDLRQVLDCTCDKNFLFYMRQACWIIWVESWLYMR
jgi:hypothetical protein